MEPNGQEASNPGAKLASLLSKREKLQDELRNIEKQVYELETTYLQDSNQLGHVSKGFEGFLSSSKSTSNLKRPRKFQPEDRIFSLSSVTSPAVFNGTFCVLGCVPLDMIAKMKDELFPSMVEEHAGGRDDLGPGRSKGGAVAASGQGKPKRGRIAP